MKPDPMQTVVGAMRFWERQQEALAHNMANVDTSGFKGERVFARVLSDAEGPVIQSRTDLRNGGLRGTGNDLDVALEGDGFMVVETERGTRLSRGGSLHLNEEGALVDQTGGLVQGEGGEIVLPEGKVEISDTGRISVDGEYIDTIQIQAAPQTLRRQDGVYFLPEPGMRAAFRAEGEGETTVKVHQGHLEQSNVEMITTLTDMITVQRHYASLMRSADAIDQVDRTVSSSISRID